MAYKRDKENDYAWRIKNIRRYSLTFNRTTDEDVLAHLEKQPNKREYIFELIRKDIKRGNKKVQKN